jgi:hypothetical protein
MKRIPIPSTPGRGVTAAYPPFKRQGEGSTPSGPIRCVTWLSDERGILTGSGSFESLRADSLRPEPKTELKTTFEIMDQQAKQTATGSTR